MAADTIAGGIPDQIRADSFPATTATASSAEVECATSAKLSRGKPPALADLLPQIATPVTTSTAATTASPVANVEFLDERLENSRVVLIDAGHFVWEEALRSTRRPSPGESGGPNYDRSPASRSLRPAFRRTFEY